ncbi:MAG: protein-methionine-sulfoxide reductase heme-binding subunit MsrQ [Chloracidobacterium sp.]|uniref:Protein-methionine-sulfoxide reductase heme-binding subunit MsrQ n=1 Tax=Chloracidobacterium validum TaxID=2821543 RepID=A0ABX8BC56_9BACT|nr:protein-methionine-sulfoxide reductase heme-binding subunit MsrQ [Chloracidobacterium validum]QUW04261.1 sulfoxide reductase heme-binding subunit YedZ [Chloracidobacterium validum]
MTHARPVAVFNPVFAQRVLLVNGLLPLVLCSWDGVTGGLGANPLEFILRLTGMLALVFLTLTLMVTPLVAWFGPAWLIKLRRTLGLFAFFYGGLHLFSYVWFDKVFDLVAVGVDVLRRPFILFGMLAFLVMLPLAATSTNGMIKRLGARRWKQLHRLTYVAAVAGAVHFYLFVKADTTVPTAFAAVIGFLLVYRWMSAQSVTTLGLDAKR